MRTNYSNMRFFSLNPLTNDVGSVSKQRARRFPCGAPRSANKICDGKPVIRGTRMPVTLIIGSLAGGMTYEEVQREYDLTISLRWGAEWRLR